MKLNATLCVIVITLGAAAILNLWSFGRLQ